jgi:hypothetical protein
MMMDWDVLGGLGNHIFEKVRGRLERKNFTFRHEPGTTKQAS